MESTGLTTEASGPSREPPGGYASANPWVGRTLGIMDTFLSWLGPDAGTFDPIPIPDRILIANTGHVGDVILATSVLPVLRSAFPRSTLGFLVGSWSKPVLENHPLVDTLHTFDHWKLNRSPSSWWEKLQRHEATRRQALVEIERHAYDVAIDLRYYFGNAISLIWQAAIPFRVGYTGGGFGPLLTHPLAWQSRPWHVVEYFGALLQLLPIRPEHLTQLRPTLPATEVASSPLLTSLRHRDTPYILLHMGSGMACKEWPAEKWRLLARRLALSGRSIVFTGRGADEQRHCEVLAAEIPGATNLCNKLDWNELTAAFRHAQLVIAVDSMAAHLTAAVNTPCVIISNGIHHPAHWAPRSKSARVVRHPVACAPCYRSHGCATMDCVNNIEVDQVWTAIEDLSHVTLKTVHAT